MVDEILKLQLETILKLVEKDEGLVLKNIRTNNSCGPGNNFMSIATVADVEGYRSTGERVSRSFFIKLLPDNKGRCDLFHVRDAFLNESYAYMQVLRVIPEVKDIIPKYIIGGEEIIVMENLATLGYKMADKSVGLDLKHCELVMKALGKFHASTFNLRLTRGERHFDNSLRSNVKDIRLNTSFFAAIAEKNMYQSVQALRLARDPTLQPAISKLEHIIKTGNTIDTLLALYDSEALRVVCHGDFWINNMLFKYNGDCVESLRLLDFQGISVASPAIDLWTFFYSSIPVELLNSCYDHLVSTYCTSFTDMLRNLNVPSTKIPEIKEIKHEIDSRELYGFSISLMYVTVIYLDIPTDIDTYMGDKDAILNSNGSISPNVVKRFSEIAKRCISRGVFDDFAVSS